MLKMRYFYPTKRFDINVIEFKSGFHKSYLLQLVAYALMLSDPNCNIIFGQNGKTIGRKLYPEQPFSLNIFCTLSVLRFRQNISRAFMLDNKMTPWGSRYALAIQKRAKAFRKWHKAGIYWVSEIPLCKDCRRDKCSFWNRICNKSVPEPENCKQRYFGKKKLLVKSR